MVLIHSGPPISRPSHVIHHMTNFVSLFLFSAEIAFLSDSAPTENPRNGRLAGLFRSKTSFRGAEASPSLPSLRPRGLPGHDAHHPHEVLVFLLQQWLRQAVCSHFQTSDVLDVQLPLPDLFHHPLVPYIDAASPSLVERV